MSHRLADNLREAPFSLVDRTLVHKNGSTTPYTICDVTITDSSIVIVAKDDAGKEQTWTFMPSHYSLGDYEFFPGIFIGPSDPSSDTLECFIIKQP